MRISLWENISLWCAVQMEAKSKLPYKKQQLPTKIYLAKPAVTPQSANSGHCLKPTVISGYPTEGIWPGQVSVLPLCRAGGSRGRMLPLFLTLPAHHFPVILGILPWASPPQSRTSLLLHWASFPTEDDEWWQVISNVLGLLFSQSRTVWSCHLLTQFSVC